MSEYVTFDELEELLSEIREIACNSYVVVDGKRYDTDWGYGEEGIMYFIDILKERARKTDGLKICDLYENESNYECFFGTPERAAQTIIEISKRVNFDGVGGDYDKLLKWMREKTVD